MSAISSPTRVVLVQSSVSHLNLDLIRQLEGEGVSVASYTDINTDMLAAALLEPPADVLVTSLALPGIGAINLLRHTQQHCPGALRIVTIDPDDEDLAMRAIGLAHNFVAQPISADSLLGILDKYRSLNRRLRRRELRTLIGSITSLPSPPQHCLRIINALADPNCHASLITELINEDPTLTAKVLQLSNSALYSHGRSVQTVAYAINRLGIRQIRNLVLAAELFTHNGSGMELDLIRRQSMLASWLAGRLLTDRLQADLASTAALLTGLAMFLPVPDDQPVNDFVSKTPVLRAEAAAYLLKLWNLPDSLIEPVAFHLNPRLSGADFAVAGAVHVAHGLSHSLPLDETYLETAGVLAHLPRWRDLVSEVNGRQAVADA